MVVSRAPGAVSGPVTFGAVSSQVTFRAGVSEKLKPGEHLGGVRAKFLARTYTAVATSLRLGKESGFREKFGAKGEDVYICYPRHGVSVRDLDEIVQFFENYARAASGRPACRFVSSGIILEGMSGELIRIMEVVHIDE